MTAKAHPREDYGPHGTRRTQVCGRGQDYQWGQTCYAPEGRYGPRTQADYQLVVLIRGHLRVSVDTTTYELGPGDAILQHPGTEVFYRFSPEVESVHTWCQIAVRRLSPAERKLLKSIRGIHRAPALVHQLIQEGLRESRRPTTGFHLAQETMARACLLGFATEVSAQRENLAFGQLHPALQRAVDLLSCDFSKRATTVDLARQAGLSSSRLRSLFQEHFQESPAAFLRRHKIDQALQLIHSTGLTLGEIAEHCGFANPFHLSRAIRKQTGQSPRALRQRAWKNSVRLGKGFGPMKHNF